MNIDGHNIPPKQYAAPAIHAAKSFLRRLIKVFIWGFLLVLILFILYRTMPAPLLNVISEKSVVVDAGAGGFSLPSRTTYWKNGWAVTEQQTSDLFAIILFQVKKHQPSLVQAYADAISDVTQAEIDATPCLGGALDGATMTYTAVQSHNGFTVEGSKIFCYDATLPKVYEASTRLYND